MTVVRSIARLAPVAAVLAALAVPVAAQQSAKFWLAAAPGNIQGCIAADPQFTREHTFTVRDGQGELDAPGGIETKLKQVKPDVFETDYQLGRLHLHVLADLSTAPPTLTVTEKNLGCKWIARKA